MTGDNIRKAVEAVGNGGTWAAAYRLSMWAFTGVAGVAGTLIYLMVVDIRDNQKSFIRSISHLESQQGVHGVRIDYLDNRVTRAWEAQDKRDSQQDRDRERIERRMEDELRRQGG